MENFKTEQLVALAETLGLSVTQAVALPTVIKTVALKVGISESTLIWKVSNGSPALKSEICRLCRVGAESLQAA